MGELVLRAVDARARRARGARGRARVRDVGRHPSDARRRWNRNHGQWRMGTGGRAARGVGEWTARARGERNGRVLDDGDVRRRRSERKISARGDGFCARFCVDGSRASVVGEFTAADDRGRDDEYTARVARDGRRPERRANGLRNERSRF